MSTPGEPARPDPGHVEPPDRAITKEIGDAISRAYKSQYGKGPENIRVHFAGDAVLAVLRGGFSIVEGSLHQAGQGAAVRDQRRAFGDMIAPTLGATVGELVGREVVTVLADTSQDPDLGAIVFVLAAP